MPLELRLLKPHQRPVDCCLELQGAGRSRALRVSKATGQGLLMRVALRNCRWWGLRPGAPPLLELQVQMGQSDGVLKFQPRAATSEEDLASLVAAISDAKGGPPAQPPGSGGDAEADNALAASAAHTAGPSLVAKRRKASQAASKNMEVLAKLKEEKEALARLRAPSVAEAAGPAGAGPAGPAPSKPQQPAEPGSRFRVMRQELKDAKVLLEAKQDEIEALKADLVTARQHAADLQSHPLQVAPPDGDAEEDDEEAREIDAALEEATEALQRKTEANRELMERADRLEAEQQAAAQGHAEALREWQAHAEAQERKARGLREALAEAEALLQASQRSEAVLREAADVARESLHEQVVESTSEWELRAQAAEDRAEELAEEAQLATAGAAAAAAEAAAAGAEVERLEAEVGRLEASAQMKETNLESLSTQLAEARDGREAAERERAAEARSKMELAEAYELAQTGSAKLVAEAAGLTEALRDRDARLRGLEAAARTHDSARASAGAEARALEAEVAQLASERDALREAVRAVAPAVHGWEDRLLRLRATASNRLEDALGGLQGLERQAAQHAGGLADALLGAEGDLRALDAAAQRLARAQAGRVRASASAHDEVGRLEAELDEATRELEAVTAELEASTATLAEREAAHAAEVARLQGALEEAGARAERQRARADGLAADKAGLERDLGEAAATHAARAAGLQGALGAAREELEAAQGLGERLWRWEEHMRGGHGALEGRAAALAQALEQVGEALKIERYVDLGEKAEILVYASQILHSLGQLEADAAQLVEKDRALAALEERAADADLLEAEVERLAGFEERYEILQAVNADLTDLGAEELAAKARDAEVQLKTLLRENAHLQEAAGELADQLRRSQALAELTAAGKAAAERELEAKVQSTKETLVANELLRLENLALKAPDLQAPPPFPVRLEKGRVQISGSAFSDVPSAGLATTVEVQATGLVFALAAEPAEVMWTEIHGWAVENDKLALHFIDSGVLDKASVLLTFDSPAPGPGPEAAGDPRRSLADLVGHVLRNCQRAAVEKAQALRMAPEFTCVTSLDKSDLRLWHPAEGADGVEPMLEQIKSIGEELAAVHTRLLAKLADPLPPEAGGGDAKVGKLEEAFVNSQATAAVLKHRFAALRTQCAAAIKQAYNGLLLARAADDGAEGGDRDPAPGPQAGALEALFKEFAFRTEPLSADMDQLPKLALKNVEKIWRRRVEASERALQELRDGNEALEERLAGFARFEAELQRREAHLQDKVEATVTANSMLEDRTKRQVAEVDLMKRREEELFYAVQVLQKQSTLLRQENGWLMEALQDSAQAVGSKVATEQGDVAAILRRARMKRLDVGKPALASEAPAIAAMLQTVPFLQAVHPDHLKDLAATARLVECRAGEAVCGPESEVIGVPLVASGRLATHAGDREYEAGHHVLDLAALANLQWGEEIYCTEPASLYWVGVFELFVWFEGHPRLKSGLHLALAEHLDAEGGGGSGDGAEGGPGGAPAAPSPLAELTLSPKEAAFAKELESLLTHAEADRGELRRENDALQQKVQSLQSMVEDAEFAFQSFRQSPAAHRSGLLVLPPHETEVDRLKAVLHQGEELLETTRLSAAAAAAGPGGVEPLSEHDLPSFVAAPATVRGPRPTVAGGPKPPAISPEVAAKARAGAGAGAEAGADPGGDKNDAPLPAATDASVGYPSFAAGITPVRSVRTPSKVLSAVNGLTAAILEQLDEF